MDSKISNNQMLEPWERMWRALGNPWSQRFYPGEAQRFVGQDWRGAEQILHLWVKAQSEWASLAIGSFDFNDWDNDAAQQSVKNWGSLITEFLQRQRAAGLRWQTAVNGFDPFLVSSTAAFLDAWGELARTWQQAAQTTLRAQVSLLWGLTRPQRKPSGSKTRAPLAKEADEQSSIQ